MRYRLALCAVASANEEWGAVMFWFYIVLAVGAGGIVAVQAGINGQMRGIAGGPVNAALISASVTVVILLALALTVVRAPWPTRAAVSDAPWWLWSGGFLGGSYLVAAVVLAPRLGGAVLFALLVVGQVLSSLVLDHFGIAGYPEHHITLTRVLGAVLVIVGAVIVQRG
jgi:transporter family-2 protein